jgi:hypothetical protein
MRRGQMRINRTLRPGSFPRLIFGCLRKKRRFGPELANRQTSASDWLIEKPTVPIPPLTHRATINRSRKTSVFVSAKSSSLVSAHVACACLLRRRCTIWRCLCSLAESRGDRPSLLGSWASAAWARAIERRRTSLGRRQTVRPFCRSPAQRHPGWRHARGGPAGPRGSARGDIRAEGVMPSLSATSVSAPASSKTNIDFIVLLAAASTLSR